MMPDFKLCIFACKHAIKGCMQWHVLAPIAVFVFIYPLGKDLSQGHTALEISMLFAAVAKSTSGFFKNLFYSVLRNNSICQETFRSSILKTKAKMAIQSEQKNLAPPQEKNRDISYSPNQL